MGVFLVATVAASGRKIRPHGVDLVSRDLEANQ